MKKKWNQFSCLFFLLILLPGGLYRCSSSGTGGTPTTDIPAPVSHLSISSPDSDGLVRVKAEAGFADGGTTVTISNPNVVGLRWLIDKIDKFVRSALAHSTHTISANADGSFIETIEGAVGDPITVAYISGGSEADEEIEVPSNTPPLPLTADIQDVTIDPTNNQALIVANDGTDGFVHFINLDDFSYESTLTLPGASGASRIATDPTSGETIVIDTANDNAVHVSGGAVNATTAISPSSDLSAGIEGGYVIIAHTDPTPALSYFDILLNAPLAVGDSENESGEDQVSASLVAVDNNGAGDILGVVSLMGDGTQILTTHQIDTVVPSINQSGAITLDGVANAGGLVLFNNAEEALVTDSNGDRVLRILLADGTVTEIEVGDDPQGVAVDTADGVAYVVNNGDRNLSVISLDDNRVTQTVELGLSPTEIAIDPTGGSETPAVINTGDETVTLVE